MERYSEAAERGQHIEVPLEVVAPEPGCRDLLDTLFRRGRVDVERLQKLVHALLEHDKALLPTYVVTTIRDMLLRPKQPHRVALVFSFLFMLVEDEQFQDTLNPFLSKEHATLVKGSLRQLVGNVRAGHTGMGTLLPSASYPLDTTVSAAVADIVVTGGETAVPAPSTSTSTDTTRHVPRPGTGTR